MGKSTHFFGQPVYGQLIKSLDREKILEISRQMGGERYIKSFDGWHHLLTMLYAVIMRFDSLREIEASMLAEVRNWFTSVLRPYPNAARSQMLMLGDLKISLRVCIVIYTSRTKPSFPRTAEEML